MDQTAQIIIILVIVIIQWAAWWKLFEKAGKPGWAAIVPIYNFIVLLEIAGKPVWWFILMFIPCVSIIIWCLVCIEVAKSYGKESGFGIGLWLLGFIFFPILAFSDAEYVGPGGSSGGSRRRRRRRRDDYDDYDDDYEDDDYDDDYDDDRPRRRRR